MDFSSWITRAILQHTVACFGSRVKEVLAVGMEGTLDRVGYITVDSAHVEVAGYNSFLYFDPSDVMSQPEPLHRPSKRRSS